MQKSKRMLLRCNGGIAIRKIIKVGDSVSVSRKILLNVQRITNPSPYFPTTGIQKIIN